MKDFLNDPQKGIDNFLTTFENMDDAKIERTAKIIIISTFIFLTILSIFPFALCDKRLYLHETSYMYLLLKNDLKIDEKE